MCVGIAFLLKENSLWNKCCGQTMLSKNPTKKTNEKQCKSQWQTTGTVALCHKNAGVITPSARFTLVLKALFSCSSTEVSPRLKLKLPPPSISDTAAGSFQRTKIRSPLSPVLSCTGKMNPIVSVLTGHVIDINDKPNRTGLRLSKKLSSVRDLKFEMKGPHKLLRCVTCC